ncbi:RecQ family ATP-dependent DNA helicase [Aquirufa rosea]|uniref:ATP-dependent DNA helicase RecQ n=1 Tax=Aquirufa rosea TaxID=2509241 RepID=A0A4Q1BYE0_9BACT|nr:ATP-dependent DNA helicase RecQ [Aquirufa rosea]RXK48089.1 RecQ family ATP-dependent DNA helicase [Aquirufa rosea]
MQEIQSILKKYWGYDTFRPLQEEIIHSILDKKDTLALLPTGGGKSICFQVPAIAMEGICLVISPLIALMQDQVNQLKQRNIPAEAIYSGMHPRQIDILLDNCIYGHIKFLYVSPERLKTDLFLERAKQMNISLLAVDEAHCISQWGYDFRPPYLEIAQFKNLFPQIPCLALTASANPEVKTDIIQKLELKNPAIFQKSFSRPNLSYSVIWEENKEKKLIQMLQRVPGSSIVYVRNRKKTQQISDLIEKSGISSTFYHAGLSPLDRSSRQKNWIENGIQCMVATNAFGMGIDKPDVRLVVHLDLPDSLEAYYQEAGRAGRDEKKAYAAVLWEEKDILELQANWTKSFPEADTLKKVYQALSNYLQIPEGSGELMHYDFEWTQMAKRFNLPASETFFALKTLESEGLILLNEAYQNPSKIKINVSATALYDFQIRNERFESFIKCLLRMFGGNLYQQFVPISEAAIAQQFKAPITDVERSLTLLEKFEILDYNKQNGLPKLTLLTPRASVSQLPIDWSAYHKKRDNHLAKIKSVEHYVRNNKICRTRLLTAYFGESLDKKCGICDTCIEQKKASTGEANPENHASERKLILHYLQHGSLSLQNLVDCLRPLSKEEAIRIIQYALDLGEITYTATDELGLASF